VHSFLLCACRDPPRCHVNIIYSSHVWARALTTLAPDSSTQTDSIHVGSSQDVLIEDSKLHSGGCWILHVRAQTVLLGFAMLSLLFTPQPASELVWLLLGYLSCRCVMPRMRP